MRMIKKYGLWIAAAAILYFTKDKWMPMLGLGTPPPPTDTQGGDAKTASIDLDEGLYA